MTQYNINSTTISLLLLLILSICQVNAQQKFSSQAKSYFKEIALGSEYGNTDDRRIKKWTKDIKVFIPNNCPSHLQEELNKIISELNALIKPLKIYKVAKSQEASLKVFTCGASEYIKHEPRARRLVAGNLGLFYVYPNANGEIQKGSVFLDIVRLKAKDTQKHMLREEFTQALGLMRDSDKYRNSIFYQKWSRTNQFSDLDKEIIRILYQKEMRVGSTPSEVERVLNRL